MFDITSLKETLNRYVDLRLLTRGNGGINTTSSIDSKNDKNDGSKNNNDNSRPRLIVTSTKNKQTCCV